MRIVVGFFSTTYKKILSCLAAAMVLVRRCWPFSSKIVLAIDGSLRLGRFRACCRIGFDLCKLENSMGSIFFLLLRG